MDKDAFRIEAGRSEPPRVPHPQRQAIALARQPTRNGQTDAARRAGDHHHPVSRGEYLGGRAFFHQNNP